MPVHMIGVRDFYLFIFILLGGGGGGGIPPIFKWPYLCKIIFLCAKYMICRQ